MIGYFITATFMLSFVNLLGQGSEQAGWRNAAIVFAIIGFALLMFAFFDSREINKPKKGISIVKSIKAAAANWP